MRKSKELCSACAIAAVFLGSTASTWAVTYIVQESETLSSIAQRTVEGRIYGKAGGLKKLLELNPEIKNPDFIFPKQKINLANEDSKLANCVPTSKDKDESANNFRPESNDKNKLANSASSPEFVNREPASLPSVHSDFRRHSSLELSPIAYYTRIDGTDLSNGSKAALLSKLNYGLSLKWSQSLANDFRTFESISIRHEKYLSDPTTTIARIDNSAQNLTHLNFGAEYDISKHLTLLTALGLSQELFYKGIADINGGITLQAVSLPKIEIGSKYRLWEGEPFYIDFEAKVLFLLPASTSSYKTKFGKGFDGKISISQIFSNIIVNAGPYYRQLYQDTSILKAARRDAGLDVGFAWRFDSSGATR